MQELYRIIDANLNRSREGLRVIEDVVRFYMNDRGLSRRLKMLRHKIADAVKIDKTLIKSRDSRHDVGREFSFVLEGGNKNIRGIITSNFRRVEESLRVLEEIHKIVTPSKARIFKNMRFKAYSLEKDIYDRCRL